MDTMTDADADRLIAALGKMAAALEPLRKRKEVPLFGRRVEIRKADTPAQPTAVGEYLRHAAWKEAQRLAQTMLDADPTLDRAEAVRRVLTERPDLLAQCQGDFDYLAPPVVKNDAGAMTVRDVAERELNALALAEQRRDPSLTDAAAFKEAMATPEGRAAYARMRAPDAHCTALELAAIAKRDLDGFARLQKWNAATCEQFVEDRTRELDADAFGDGERLAAAYAVVAAAFPHEWAAARAGR